MVELCELAIFTSQEFVWENNSFSPLETASWFHQKFKVKRNVGEYFPFLTNWILAEVGTLFNLNGERAHRGTGLEGKEGLAEDERGVETPRGTIDVLPRSSLEEGQGTGGNKLWENK